MQRAKVYAASAVALILVVGVALVGPASFAFFSPFGTAPSYKASVVVVRGLSSPDEIMGENSGTIFFTNYPGTPFSGPSSCCQPSATVVTVNTLSPGTLATSTIATFTDPVGVNVGEIGNWLPAGSAFDPSGNLYYVVGYSNGTEAIVEQAKTPSGYSPPAVLYRDAPCGTLTSPNFLVCALGITDLTADPSGDIFFSEVFPTTPAFGPAGNGNAYIKEVPSGTTTAKTLFTTFIGNGRFSLGIDQVVYASGKLYFTSGDFGTGMSEVMSYDLSTGVATVLLSLPSGPNGSGLLYIAVGPTMASAGGQVRPSTESVYYLYRVSSGPTKLGGAPSGYPPAELVLGSVGTGAAPTPSPPGSLPGEIADETFPSSVSVAVFIPPQGFLQVSSSGNVFFFLSAWTAGGFFSSGAADVQWYSPSASTFSQLASEDIGQTSGLANFPTFALDGSGNFFYATNTGTMIEIPFG